MACSVLIIEDDARFREAFSHAVSLAGDMTLVGSASDYTTGLSMLRRLPDVMLVDLELPDGNGIDLIREAAKLLPQCDVMVVTVFGDERHVLQSIEAGATGYLLKDLPAEELVEQIRVLRAGGSPISPIIARQLLTRFTATQAEMAEAAINKDECAPLSAQEIKVLSLTAKGYSYDEIANLMQISRHTVQTYVKRIYRKLQVNSKFEALFEARRLKLINQ
jgi:DNA-binding NarL/FixJ family response regulator